MKQTMERQDDRLLREALRQRAERVPALSDDFEEGVMARLQPHASSSLIGEDLGTQTTVVHGLRLGVWRTLTWVANVAAVAVVGWFVFFGNAPSSILHLAEGSSVSDTSLVTEGQKLPTEEAYPRERKDPNHVDEPHDIALAVPKTSAAKPMASRSHKAGLGRVTSSEENEPVPTHADLQATLEQMEREALRQADDMIMLALARVDAAASPS